MSNEDNELTLAFILFLLEEEVHLEIAVASVQFVVLDGAWHARLRSLDGGEQIVMFSFTKWIEWYERNGG